MISVMMDDAPEDKCADGSEASDRSHIAGHLELESKQYSMAMAVSIAEPVRLFRLSVKNLDPSSKRSHWGYSDVDMFFDTPVREILLQTTAKPVKHSRPASKLVRAR